MIGEAAPVLNGQARTDAWEEPVVVEVWEWQRSGKNNHIMLMGRWIHCDANPGTKMAMYM